MDVAIMLYEYSVHSNVVLPYSIMQSGVLESIFAFKGSLMLQVVAWGER